MLLIHSWKVQQPQYTKTRHLFLLLALSLRNVLLQSYLTWDDSVSGASAWLKIM